MTVILLPIGSLPHSGMLQLEKFLAKCLEMHPLKYSRFRKAVDAEWL
jgi:hypothetical protein